MASEQPKIIIDSDWKSQAQAEKERLAAGAKPPPATPAPGSLPTQAAPAATPASGARTSRGPGLAGMGAGLPAAQIEDLIGILMHRAVSYLGGYVDPRTGQAMVSLDYAKLHIDLLALLEEKTKGNLTPQEASTLSRALHELRMEFVEVSKEVEKAMAEGRISTVGPDGRVTPPRTPGIPGIPGIPGTPGTPGTPGSGPGHSGST